MAGQKPVAKFQAGQISAALWENEIEVKGRTVTVLKSTVQRRYTPVWKQESDHRKVCSWCGFSFMADED